jgi:hypothetical protein
LAVPWSGGNFGAASEGARSDYTLGLEQIRNSEPTYVGFKARSRKIMSNVLEEASEWLSGQIDANASSPVLYRRGSLTAPVVAGKAKTIFEVPSVDGMLVQIESHDWIITAQAISLDGVVSRPALGDRIIETVGGKLHAYEVTRFGQEQHYRQCDPFGHKLRVHTKYTGVVASL